MSLCVTWIIFQTMHLLVAIYIVYYLIEKNKIFLQSVAILYSHASADDLLRMRGTDAIMILSEEKINKSNVITSSWHAGIFRSRKSLT